MLRTKIAGMGYYVPEKVVTNFDLMKLMDTSDEWIQERSGIIERRYAKKHEETTSTMGAAAARMAMDSCGVNPEEIDFIIFATLSPDYFFPGCGVLAQRALGISKKEIPALDIRNQCSGFIYGLEVADQFIKTGKYKNILLIASELQSHGLDFTTRGRNVSVLFGDGAGAVILQPTEDEDKGILTTHLHSDGTEAEVLSLINPGSHCGYHLGKEQFGYPDIEYGGAFVTDKMFNEHMLFPQMDGQAVFKKAVTKFPEVIHEALKTAGYSTQDVKLVIPHQANLRISQFVQRLLRLTDDQMYNNIQKYGNTTAASIPIAMCEAKQEGRYAEGDLVCLAAFGSGFTWASALVRF
ncbi:MAG TPA: beta-ketoacyl-ACP synthase III [Saprospiraceae bacterium]|nr:beta-ketoacyl-ACP synthase III [Saprospiraceae bacterium]